MSIRCGSCKARHDTVQQVLDCSARKAGQSTCKHDLDPGTCILCARWNKRKGTFSMTSRTTTVEWVKTIDTKATGICSLCREPISEGDRITVQKGRNNWAHTDCFVDPGTVYAQLHPTQKSQHEPDPEFNSAYDRIQDLFDAAGELLAEAIAVEEETTILCLRQVAEDMDWELSIDLIRETIYGYDLELLGAWEPKDESDTQYIGEDARAMWELSRLYAAL